MKPGFTLDTRRGRPEPDEDAKANGAVVEHLRIAAGGTRGLSDCPTWLRETLERMAWLRFADFNTNQIFEYSPDEFDKFARAPVPEGLNLGGGEEQLRQICETFLGRHPDAEIALRLIKELTPKLAEHGGTKGNQNAAKERTAEHEGSNTISVSDRGSTYQLRRLKRDRPDLARKVERGELSANAAAVQAGFRPAMVQHPATVEGFTRAILAHLTAKEQADVIDGIRRPLAVTPTRKRKRA